MREVVAGVLAIAGSMLVLLAGIGVVRFPELLARMHAATKAPTLGFMLIATAGAVALDERRGKLVIAVALILLTGPVAAHLVARAAYEGPGGRPRVDADDELGPALDRSTGHGP